MSNGTARNSSGIEGSICKSWTVNTEDGTVKIVLDKYKIEIYGSDMTVIVTPYGG